MAPNDDDRLFKIRSVIDSLLPKFQAQQQILLLMSKWFSSKADQL